MAEILIYVAGFLALLFFELLYFRVADRYKIIDKPNHRSSHSDVTIRGGGIVFAIAALIWFFYNGSFPYFILGLILIAAISFIDDLVTLRSGVRSVIHLLALSLLLYQTAIDIPSATFLLVLILSFGTINAYNFMDGINGITGAYSLVTLASLFFVNRFVVPFTSEALLVFILLSLLVFNFFNFRKRAKCFAGDVGSVSIAFTICFLLIQLIIQTQNLLFISFLIFYGADAVTTILFRIIRRENITEAHRSHFYQYLANDRYWPHLRVSGLYSGLQGIINVIVIARYSDVADFYKSLCLLLVCLVITGSGFVLIRLASEGKDRLFKRV